MEQIIRPAFIHRLRNIIQAANDLLILANEKETEDYYWRNIKLLSHE